MIRDIIIIAMFVNFMYFSFNNKGFWLNWLVDPLLTLEIFGIPEYFFKPVYKCIYCMASLWGTIGYLLINELDIYTIINTPGKFVITLCAVSFTGAVLFNILRIVENLLPESKCS